MINKAILIGNIGTSPEIKTLESGHTVANFTMATNRNYQKNGEWETETQWHNVTAWRQLAERCSELEKGMMVYVEGEIKYRKYVDNDGKEKWTTNIEARTIRKLDKKPKE